MRGVIFDGKRTQVVDDLEIRDPGPGEVQVAITAAGLCHSDLSVVDGTIPFPSPWSWGMRARGRRGGGRGRRPCPPRRPCRALHARQLRDVRGVRPGRPTMCRKAIGMPRQPFTRGGRPLYQFASNSAFAERTVVKAVQAVRIPKDIPSRPPR